MARRFGPLVPVLLVAVLLLVQFDLGRRSERLHRGEDAARQALWTLAERGPSASEETKPHPGFAALLGEPLELEVLDLPGANQEFASDASYMFALSRGTHRDDATGRTLHSWELRAWPRSFGRTGDAEYVLTQAGELYESRNPRGRSGTTRGFPPPLNEPDPANAGRRWWRRQPDDHR